MELRYQTETLRAYRAKAEALVAQLTLDEKAAQTLYDAPAIERLQIPAYNWWNEALHGVARAGTATVFPQAIAMAAAFDETMIETVGDAVATEARAKYNAQSKAGDYDIYKGLTVWSPNVNIFRDPRWGRGHETYGEDPYLTSRLGVRYIQGLQGHDAAHLKTAACAKHFAVHSGPEALRHSFDAKTTAKDLHETYLPAFKACVQEGGVEIVMGAYNRVNGEACCAHSQLQDILRRQWGFVGHFTSDFGALKDFYEGHDLTQTAAETAAFAMRMGCDLNAGWVYRHLADAVRSGLVEETCLDEAVTRLFVTRLKLGILQKTDTSVYDAIPYSVVDSAEMRALNRSVALRCPVLLKNDGILPLQKGAHRTIGVIGPNADSRCALVGNYEGTASRYVTVLEGLQDYLGDETRILYAQGCDLFRDRTSGLARANDRASEVEAVCAESDIIIAVMGMDATIEGEEGDAGNEFGSGDKENLRLPGLQQSVLQQIYESGKPAVLITLCGSALALDWAHAHCNAVIHAWYPGAEGGWALARLLFGQENFSGRLPITFYSEHNCLPDFTDYSMQNRTYRFLQEAPLYPFGYGLSYTSIVYSDAKTAATVRAKETLAITVTVQNNGAMNAVETVQLYTQAPDAKNTALKALATVPLAPGESKVVTLTLAADAFTVVDDEGCCIFTKGTWNLFVGGCQPDARSIQLTKAAPQTLAVQAE